MLHNNNQNNKLKRLTLLREVYRALINSGRTYASFEEEKVYPLVELLSDRKEIFDPMSGYGSLLQYCSWAGIKSYSIEYNLPQYLWQMICHTKYSVMYVQCIEELLQSTKRFPRTTKLFEASDDWFTEDGKIILRKLYVLIKSIIQKSTTDATICEELSLAILLPFVGRFACSVPADISTHTKKGGICVYKEWESDLAIYLKALKGKIEDLKSKSRSISHILRLGDSQKISLPKGRFKAMITSPPYPNSRDFTSIFNIENNFLHWLNSTGEIIIKPLNNSIIGSNFVSGKTVPKVTCNSAIQFLKKIENYTGSKRAQYDNKVYYLPYFSLYFASLEAAYANIANSLNKEFEGYIVVVNNTARNIIIPVEQSIIEIWRTLGFKADICQSEESFHYGTKNPRAKGLRAKHTEYIIKVWR